MIFKVNRIETKLSFLMVSLFVMAALVVVAIIYTITAGRLVEGEMANVSTNMIQESKILNKLFLTPLNLTKAIAQDKRFLAFMEDPKGVKEVGEINQKLTDYSYDLNTAALYLIGANGVVLASTDETAVGKNFANKDFFTKPMGGENYADVVLGMSSKKLEYYFSSPVRKGLQNVGVVVARTDPKTVFDFLKGVEINAVSNVMVVDRLGVVVGSADEGMIFKSLGTIGKKDEPSIYNKFPGLIIDPWQYSPNISSLTTIKTIDSFGVQGQDGSEKKRVVVAKVPNFDFYLVGEIDNTEVANRVRGFEDEMVRLTLIALAVFIAFTIMIVTRELNPLNALIVMSRRISLGDFDSKNPIKGDDEMAELGKTMENMADTIKHRYDELEKMVSERTVKLTEQAETVEKTKTAITNILSDVEDVAADLEKFKMAVENASDHIVITDPDGIVIYVNKMVEEATGFDRVDIIGKKAGNKDLWGGQMTLNFYQNLWKTIKIDKKVFEGEVNNRKETGQPYIAKLTISPVLNSREDVVYFVGIERDITKEKEVDQSKTDFIYLTSHQLRTPLSAMKWFCEMLLAEDAGELNKDQREFVTNISQSNERMISLINSLLNISRIESGRIIIDPEPTDLGVLVQDVLTELDNKIKEKKQGIVMSIYQNLPKINVDPKLIREVYRNLLSNANKYTQEGGEITIIISKKGKEIISQVSDNGFGIPKEDQSKIFERFYRAENIIKLETEGTGLGLYLAKAIVESSNGKIWFKSEEKVGTTFWFTLPIAGVKAQKGQVSINS